MWRWSSSSRRRRRAAAAARAERLRWRFGARVPPRGSGLALTVLLSAVSAGCNCGVEPGPADSGTPDAGVPDAGIVDAGPHDAGVPDAGPPDAGPPDAGPPDAGDVCSDAGVIVSSQVVATTSLHLTGATAATAAGAFSLHGDGGLSLEGPVPTGAGTFDVTVPLFCGLQTLDLRWPGPTCVDSVRVNVERQQCNPTDLQVTLSWDDLGLDFELHLVKEGGHLNDDATDCTWTSCIGSSPDRGVVGDLPDNPHKDVDNTGHYGPENIYLNQPEPILYTVLVEHWGLGAPGSSGQVTILLGNGSAATFPITHLASHWVDTVATIDWSTRTITPVGSFTDCTGSWSNGCTLPLP
jgi:hypothetical protein